MAQIQYAKRLLNLKIAYYGPPGAGKATNLEALRREAPWPRSPLAAVELEGETAWKLQFRPEWAEPVAGLRLNLQLFAAPGEAFERTYPHRLVLEGADAVVFVADSTPGRLEANQQVLADLSRHLALAGESLESTPLVFQWNKRDLPGVLPVERLEAALAPEGAPGFPAVASEGQGVLEPLRRAVDLVVARIVESLREGPE